MIVNWILQVSVDCRIYCVLPCGRSGYGESCGVGCQHQGRLLHPHISTQHCCHLQEWWAVQGTVAVLTCDKHKSWARGPIFWGRLRTWPPSGFRKNDFWYFKIKQILSKFYFRQNNRFFENFHYLLSRTSSRAYINFLQSFFGMGVCGWVQVMLALCYTGWFKSL